MYEIDYVKYIYIYIYIYICIILQGFAILLFTSIYMHTCRHRNIYIYIYIHSCIYIQTHTHTHTHIYIYIYIYVCIYPTSLPKAKCHAWSIFKESIAGLNLQFFFYFSDCKRIQSAILFIYCWREKRWSYLSARP